MLNRIMGFIKKQNLISQRRLGFRPKYSTEIALQRSIELILTAFHRDQLAFGRAARTRSREAPSEVCGFGGGEFSFSIGFGD